MTRIAFGLMSAGYSNDTVDQLVAALAPAPVIIHHDSHRFPQLRLSGDNAHLVPDPIKTGWGVWAYVDGAVRLLEHALNTQTFDTMVMLSPTCLPLRPINELVDYLDGHPADAYIDTVMLDEDPEALMEFAYRVFFPANSIRQRAMLKLRSFANGANPDRIDRHGLNIARPTRKDWRWRLGLRIAQQALRGNLSVHPLGKGIRPAVSSAWFAATRSTMENIVAFGHDKAVRSHFSRCRLIDECFFATAIANMGGRIEPMLHFVNDFDIGGHPALLDAHGLARARASGKFFGRKFADNPDDPVRLAALNAIERADARRASVELTQSTPRAPAAIAQKAADHAAQHIEGDVERNPTWHGAIAP